jgi:catechol-2,3-dioxygenase
VTPPTDKETVMAISRLNHAVLYVRDVPTSLAFYRDVLGFRVKAAMGPQAVFLQAPDSTNDHDLALFGIGAAAGDSAAGRSTVGMYHLAWELGTLAELEEHADRLARAGALVGASDHGTTKSLYAKDPDGLEFEVVWLVPAHLVDAAAVEASARISPLDLEREKARYGADTRGGVGISVTA